MIATQRYDRLPVKAKKDESGFLRDDAAVLTRSGIFEYRDPATGKMTKEYRPPEEVFHADHLASMKGVPITNDHPTIVHSGNAKHLVIGTVLSNGRQDGTDVLGEIVIHNTDAVDRDGKKELSLGYKLDLDETPGVTPDGQRYDAVQRNLRVNHLAVVKKGRAGTARLNLDAADAVIVPGDVEMNLVKVHLDSGLAYDAAPEIEVYVKKLVGDMATLQKTADANAARADSAEAKVKEAEAKVAQARADGAAAARARIDLEAQAKAAGVTFKADSTDRDLRESVIKKVRGDSFDLSGKSDEYVSVAFDMALADKPARKDGIEHQRREVHQGTGHRHDANDKPDESAASARDRMIAKLNNKVEA